MSSDSAGAGVMKVVLLPWVAGRLPPAGEPVTVTVLSTCPASTSAWVTGMDFLVDGGAIVGGASIRSVGDNPIAQNLHSAAAT